MSAADGFGAFAEGYRLVRGRGILRFLLLPGCISTGVIAAGAWFVIGALGGFSAWLEAALPAWLSPLAAIIAPILYVLAILAGGWLFAWLAAIAAGPFMGDLSREVERRALLPVAAPDAGWLAALAAGAGRELRKLAYHLPRLLLALLVTLIPVVNVVAPAVWFALGAWSMAVQFADLPGENRGEPFASTPARLRARPGATLAFGACVALCMSVPVVNLAAIPIAVAGGTLLWHRTGEHRAHQAAHQEHQE